MTAGTEPSLTERREEIRAQLRAQRLQIAAQLGAAAAGGSVYPRSVTMRLLIRLVAMQRRTAARPLPAAALAGLALVLALPAADVTPRA